MTGLYIVHYTSISRVDTYVLISYFVFKKETIEDKTNLENIKGQKMSADNENVKVDLKVIVISITILDL